MHNVKTVLAFCSHASGVLHSSWGRHVLQRALGAVPVALGNGSQRWLQTEKVVRGVAAVAEQHAVARVRLAAAPARLLGWQLAHGRVGRRLQDPVLVQPAEDGWNQSAEHSRQHLNTEQSTKSHTYIEGGSRTWRSRRPAG